jgi:Asp-tRNA(Asn)/Glu-tRNA(Gln) amidotransferase A subunit family amidase
VRVPASSAIAALADGRRSATELVDELLDAIAARGAQLGCLEHVDADGARAAARAADRARAAGDERPLLGVPIVVKDIIDVAGMPTAFGARRPTAGDGSPALPGAVSAAPPVAALVGRVARADAACVAALRAAGCVILAKAHTNEWAFGIDGRNPWRAPCRNPHDLQRLPGGSSSGPAVAVAAGLALGAVGTDTSGSLRVPGALCGVTALRPTPGRVALTGIAPLAPSYDVAGPMASTPGDVAQLLAAMAGPPLSGTPPAARPRVGVVTSLAELADDPVAAALADAARELDAGPVDVPQLADALAVHATVQLYEAARSHAARGGDVADLAPDVADRIRTGARVDDDAYAAGRAARAAISAALLGALERYDALLAPSVPILAPRRDAPSPRTQLLSCAVPIAQAPVPAVTVPLPVTGLPIGAQLIGRPGEDEALLALAARLVA